MTDVEKKREREDEISIVPVKPSKEYTLEKRKAHLHCINGKWYEYEDFADHFVMIYKDTNNLAILLDNDDDDVLLERNPAMFEEVYQNLLNCFFDQLHGYACQFKNRTILLGRGYDRFNGILLNTNEQYLIVDVHTNEDDPFSADIPCDSDNVKEFLHVLCKYVNEHADRPVKKMKK